MVAIRILGLSIVVTAVPDRISYPNVVNVLKLKFPVDPIQRWLTIEVILKEKNKPFVTVVGVRKTRILSRVPELVSVIFVIVHPDEQLDNPLSRLVPEGKVIYKIVVVGCGTIVVKLIAY